MTSTLFGESQGPAGKRSFLVSIGNVSILFSFPFRKFKEPSFPIAAKDSADLYEYAGGEGRPMKSPETEWANRCAGAASEVSAEPSWDKSL